MATRFLHTSDWQIGMKGSGLGRAGSRVAAQRIETLERIFQTARSRDVNLVLACGDLFERNEVDGDTVERVATIIGRYADIAVHAIPGNHDVAGPGSVWNRDALRRLGNLHLCKRPEPVSLPGLVLHPFPVTSRYSGRDPLADLPDLSGDADIHVAMAHGHLTSVTFGAHEEEIRLPIDPRHVERSGLDYLALGHWHGTRIERTADGRARIAYSGTHEQTSYRETGAGNVLLVEIEAKGSEPRITPIRLGVLAWASASFAFAEDVTLDRFLDTLRGIRADFLELEFRASCPSASTRSEVMEEVEERFSDLRIKDADLRWGHGEGSPSIDISDASLQKVLQRLQAEAAAASGREQEVLRDVVSLRGRLIRESVA